MPTPREDEERSDFVSRCIPIVLEDGTAEDQDQAVAICNSMWRQTQEEKAVMFNCECLDCGHVIETDQHCADVTCPECAGQMRRLERPGPGKMKQLIDIDGEQVAVEELIAAYKASKAVTKKEADGEHPSGHYLVVEDSEKPTTWHLRVRNLGGEPDHRLMGAAWAALHGGYRGNKYEGPDKQEAIAKLRRLYEQEDLEAPSKITLMDFLDFDEDALVSIGGAVKAYGDGKTAGWLVEFTDPTRPDLEADYFDAVTDYGPHTFSLAFYHHGADKALGRRPLKNAATLDTRDGGVWMEHQLDLRNEYEATIYRLAEQGKLGLSSGTAPHLVEREQKGDVNHITRWYLGLDASYTPTPANWRSRIMPLKSYIKSVGSVALDVGDVSITQDRPTNQDAEPKGAEASGESVARRRGMGRIQTLMLQMRTSED